MAACVIKIEDNRGVKIPDGVAMTLRRFAGITLKELSEKDSNLLIFPHCLGDNGDKIGEECLFSLTGENLSVGNVVGFWGVDDVHVHVHSRFDTDERQYFFHYMLQRVSGVNILNMNILPEENNIWDFLIYLFPLVLKQAMAQGIFRTYRVFEYDDDHLRGHVDVARFIRHDTPFAGRIAYATREHTANNHVIQLVRHTVEFVRRRNPMLLSVDTDMRQAVDTIIRLTPDYEDRDRGKIISLNLRPVRHPYYFSYTALQKICLQILRHERITFGEKDGTICGIVFNAAWLWEEYLSKVFADNKETAEIVHPQNKQCKNPVHFFRSKFSPHYPDFYDERRRLVMDAKYKDLRGGIGREDLFQLISYLHVLKYNRGALIFPSHENHYITDGDLNGFGGLLGRLSFAVPMSSATVTFRDFATRLHNDESDFIKLLEYGSSTF